jgi:hypothetical protein
VVLGGPFRLTGMSGVGMVAMRRSLRRTSLSLIQHSVEFRFSEPDRRCRVGRMQEHC